MLLKVILTYLNQTTERLDTMVYEC